MARVAEPWQLSTYAAVSSPGHPFLAAVRPVNTPTPSTSKIRIEDAEVAVVTVQGDGVHLIELAEQTPLESFTLGPSVRFTTPAVSRSRKNESMEEGEVAGVRRTYVGVEAEDRQGEVWCWTTQEKRDGTPMMEAEKTVHKTARVHALAAPASGQIVYILAGDSLSGLYDDFELAASIELPKSSASSLRRLFLHPAPACDLLPARLQSDEASLAIVVTFVSEPATKSGKNSRARTTASIDLVLASYDVDSPRFASLAHLDVTEEDVLDAVVSPSGFVTVWTAQNELQAYRIKLSLAPSLEPVDTLRLADISPFSSSPSQNALLSLGDSFTLLAGRRPNETSITFLIWDLRFSAMLAEQSLPLPSPLEGQSDIDLTLDRLSIDNVSLTLTTPGKRAHALILPISIPLTSALAHVVGTHATTSRYLATNEATILPLLRNPLASDKKAERLKEAATKRKEALTAITAALQQRSDADEAQSLYEAWYAAELERIQAYRADVLANDARPKKPIHRGKNRKKYYHQQDQYEGSKLLRKRAKKQDLPDLPADFVAALLNVIFASDRATPASLPVYPVALLHQLMHRDVVFNYMVPGGLLAQLIKRSDWEGITLAMQQVPDLPESDLVHVLRLTVDANVADDIDANGRKVNEEEVAKSEDEQPADAMLVDNSTTKSQPPLTRYLARFIRYPTSLVSLRTALRQHLTLETLGPIIDVLEMWLDYFAGGVKRYRIREPSLEGTIRFTRALLDAFFVGLLTDTALHERLEGLVIAVRKLVIVSTDLQTLLGPLQAFVRANKTDPTEEEKEVIVDAKERRKEKKAKMIAESMNIGEYVVESFNL